MYYADIRRPTLLETIAWVYFTWTCIDFENSRSKYKKKCYQRTIYRFVTQAARLATEVGSGAGRNADLCRHHLEISVSHQRSWWTRGVGRPFGGICTGVGFFGVIAPTCVTFRSTKPSSVSKVDINKTDEEIRLKYNVSNSALASKDLLHILRLILHARK